MQASDSKNGNEMIPRIIHYCWFGGTPLPPLAEECIASWHQYMPQWQYMRWDESNFSMADAPLYVRQAYEAKKYAFVSDYVRLWALVQYGGVYLDTDVKVLKSFEPLLQDTAFIGREESKAQLFGTCVMGCEPHCRWIQDMLALYDGISFLREDGSCDLTTNVQRLGARINQSEDPMKEWRLRIYTHDYFSPITSTRVMRRTAHTYAIHYYAGTWTDAGKSAKWREWTITREIVNFFVQIKRALSRS